MELKSNGLCILKTHLYHFNFLREWGVVKFDHFQTWANNMYTQHVATGWPTRGPAMLRYVALKCCNHLAGAWLVAPINKLFFNISWIAFLGSYTNCCPHPMSCLNPLSHGGGGVPCISRDRHAGDDRMEAKLKTTLTSIALSNSLEYTISTYQADWSK